MAGKDKDKKQSTPPTWGVPSEAHVEGKNEPEAVGVPRKKHKKK